ncbi:hypothetical protein O181_132460 [Austropuccinia psidii MF-1]|uniref:Uncharacterized protein n=1 Tax=Austropuccinia psidii MF-1 TaxID=1389203 RepID=A0A9Q3QCV4_9BASI|nr:hypothetical protein [Austropuccinia psidii MF-1]
MFKLWLQKSTGTLLEVVRGLHMALRKQFIEIINRFSKEMIAHVNNFPPHICALNGKVSHYSLQMAFDNFKTKFPPMKNGPTNTATIKALSKCQRLEISEFHPKWNLNLSVRTCYQGDDQTVGKERKNEAKKIFEDIGEDLFQRPIAEITPIIQHFQDALNGKAPFDQIAKSQADDKYDEDPL